MTRIHIFIFFYVLSLVSCSTEKTIKKNENSLKISKQLFESTNNDILLIKMFLDSLSSNNNGEIFYGPSRLYQKSILNDLNNKSLLKSDTIVFIESNRNCIDCEPDSYTAFVYTSSDKKTNRYSINSTNYNDGSIIKIEKVVSHGAICALLKNNFQNYLQIWKSQFKNKCKIEFNCTMFTKLENIYNYWHKQVFVGERECIK